MMRIGMMVDTYKPHVSGITNYIDLNKQYLEKLGHDVFVFTFGDHDYQDNEPRVIRSPGLPLANTGYYLLLALLQGRPEILADHGRGPRAPSISSGRLALH